MNSYQDIKIMPDAEMRENVLLNKVYTKLHKAIYDLKADDIGISFPQVNKKLGCVIRIHSSNERLQELQKLNWLGGLSGYCKVGEVLTIPNDIKGYQVISRIRQTMSLAKLSKRIDYQKKHGDLKTDDEVKAYEKQYKAKMFQTGLDNPYLELQSSSTGQLYRIYIHFSELAQQPTSGQFNRFGLSKNATVPIF